MTVAPEEVKVHFFNIRLTQIMWTSGIISINIRTSTQHYSFMVLIVCHAHGTRFVTMAVKLHELSRINVG